MANKAISELPQAQNVNNQDLFVLEQSGIAKKLTAETFITEQGIIDALAEALDGHGGIQSVTLSSVSGRIRTYRITFSDGSATTFQVYDGTSIERISRTSSSGLDDVYTVFLSDGTTTFFTVHNGADGTVSEAMLNDALKNKAPAVTETTESSAIANFTDGADDMPVTSLVAEIEPVQDLHGYDNPWPAGGGRNLCPMTATSGSGTNGLSITVNDDLTFYATKTGGAWGLITLGTATLKAGSYKIYEVSDNDTNAALNVMVGDTNIANTRYTKNGQSFSLTEDTEISVTYSRAPATTSPVLVKAMIYPATDTDTSYSPYSNICPISGHTQATVTRTGKNLLPNLKAQDTANRVRLGESTTGNGNPFKAGKYKISVGITSGIAYSIFWRTYKNGVNGSVNNSSNIVLTEDTNVKIWLFADSPGISVDNIEWFQVELGLTATAYEPYQGATLTVDWTTEAGTVYGGTIDVATGLLTVDKGIITINGSEGSWGSDGNRCVLTMPNTYADSTVGRISIICDTFRSVLSGGTAGDCFGYFNSDKRFLLYFYPWNGENLSQFKSWLSSNNIQVVYPLATAQTYQLTPQEVKTLLGTNNVWADTGNVSVTYPADTKMFIEKLTMPTEDDLIANQAITSGKYFMIGNSLYLALANIASGAQITIGTNAQRVSLADALNTINS